MERGTDGCYEQVMRSFHFALPAVVLATLYVACADPPKKNNHKGGAGSSGAEVVGDAGASGDAGAIGDAGSDSGGDSGSGSGGTSNGGSNTAGGKGGKAGASANGGSGGLLEAVGGEGGMSSGEAGKAGGAPIDPPIDPCTTTTIGTSKLPVPPTTGTVAQPSGAAGGFKVVNWAGFKGAISYTFDDNLASQVVHYDDLNAVGVPMTFYIVGSSVGNNATWTKAVNDGHELGNHTLHHCNTDGTGCWGTYPFTDIDNEIDACSAKLKTNFGVDPHTFAAPMGDSGWGTPALQRFILNRGVNDGSVSPTGGDAKNLPCHIASLNESAASFNAVSDDARSKGTWRIILAHNVDPAITDGGYNPVKLQDIVGTMTYTKGLGDVWVDTMVSVGGYWTAQKALATVQPATTGTTKTYSWKLPTNFPKGQYVRATVTGGTVKQCGTELAWDERGYYEINLDAGSVTVSP